MNNKDVKKGEEKKMHSGYNEELDKAKIARNNQKNDTNPMIEKEGFLGIDDIDRLRRRKIK